MKPSTHGQVYEYITFSIEQIRRRHQGKEINYYIDTQETKRKPNNREKEKRYTKQKKRKKKGKKENKR